jgi:integrase
MTPRQRTYGRGRVFRKKQRGREYGNYILAVCVGGEERRIPTSTQDHAEAIRQLNEKIGDITTGRAPAAGAHRTTIGDLMARRAALFELERRPSLPTEHGHVAVITAALGKVRAAELTEAKLWAFVKERRKAGDSDTTINRRLASVRAALRAGQEAKPPTVGPGLPQFPKFDESENVRQGFATVDEAETIFTSLRERDGDLADAVEWKFWTGMRKGLIARLGWDLWDGETSMLRLPPPGRKKRTPQAIPLLPGHPLRAIIDRRWARRKERAQETGRLEPLIFWRIHKGAPRKGLRPGDAVRVYEYRKAFESAAKAAGHPGLTPHDLRRTAVRNAWQATRDRRLAMLLSGHATESMFIRYNIDRGEGLADALSQIAAYVEAQPSTARRVIPLPRRGRRKAEGR